MKKTYTLNFILGLFLMSIGTLATAQCENEYSEEYFWGVNGEGSFDDGFGDWTVNVLSSDPTETWEITPDGLPLSPNFSGGTTAITSPTGACGAAQFSFLKHQLVDNPDIATAHPDDYLTYIGELISPTLDCTGKENITVEFYMQNHNLNHESTYAYSLDDGATWVALNAAGNDLILPSGQGAATEKVAIPMPAFANQPNCKFKIVANGDFYYLTIDDFALKVESTPDLAIDPAWIAGAVCYGTPATQTIGMPLMADINNQSAIPSTSSVLTANVYNLTEGTLVETFTQDYGTIAAGTEDGWNQVFSKLFTPDAAVGQYLTEYIVKDPLDLNPTNDTATVTFEITENTFEKVIAPADIGQVSPEDYLSRNRFAATDKHCYGNAFYIKNGNHSFDGVRVGFAPDDGATFTSGTVYFDLYSWVDLDGNGICNVTAGGIDEKTRLGGTDILVTSGTTVAEAADMFVEIYDDEGDTIVLEDETQYMVMMAFDLFDEGFFYDVMYNGDAVNRQFYDAPVEYAYDTLQMKERDGSVFRFFTDYDEIDAAEIGNISWGSMFMNTEISLLPVTGVNDINEDLNVNVYPTLASEVVNVDLDLEEITNVLNLELVSLDGKVALSETYNNVSRDNISLDVTGVQAGSYLVNIRTDAGMISKKVMVIR